VGLNSAQIGAIEIADIAVFTTAQVRAIEARDIGAVSVDHIATLTSAQMSGLTAAQIVAMDSKQIAAIDVGSIVGLTTAAIRAIQVADVSGLSVNQISAMTTAQIGAISASQLQAFSADQVTAYLGNTPLILDMNGDGIQTLAAKNGVVFDVNNDGQLEKSGWVGSSDALLVRDLNGDCQINDGGELFGVGTVLANGQKAKNGYLALSALDSNLDGLIDANDAAFSQLSVWIDRNSNGVTDAGELSSLSEKDIASLSLQANSSAEINNGNLIGLMGSYTNAAGETQTMGDVWFAVDSNANKADKNEPVELNLNLGDVISKPQADLIAAEASAHNNVALDGGALAANLGSDGADAYMVYVKQDNQSLLNDKLNSALM